MNRPAVSAVVLMILSVIVQTSGLDFLELLKREEDSVEQQEDPYECTCEDQCDGVSGIRNFPCEWGIKTRYIQCHDSTCSIVPCPSDKLFSPKTQTCESCPASFHVDTKTSRCVCEKEFIKDIHTGECKPCPAGASSDPDGNSCSCGDKAHDYKNNICRDCPAEAYVTGGSYFNLCICNDKEMIFVEETFSCQKCPGVWVDIESIDSLDYPEDREVSKMCQCTKEDEFFNQWSGACETCSSGSILEEFDYDRYCKCLADDEYYSYAIRACVKYH